MPPSSVPLDAIRQPALLYRRDRIVQAANAAAVAWAGRPLAGRTPLDLIGLLGIRRGDGSALLPVESPAWRALAGEDVVDVPLTVTTADGRTLSVLASASPIRDGGAIAGALECWQDVTSPEATLAEQAHPQHESEGRATEIEVQNDELRVQADELLVANAGAERQRDLLEAVLGALPHRVTVWDRDQRLVWGNRRFADDLGLSLEKLTGRSWRELGYDPAVLGPLSETTVRSTSGGGTHEGVAEVAGPAGTAWLRFKAVPIFGDSVLVIAEDVTERHRAGETLRENGQRNAFLLALGDRLREAVDVGEITGAASELLGRHLGANGVVFCEVDAVGECATVRADWTDGTVPAIAGRFRMDDFGIGDCYRRGLVRRTDDVAGEHGRDEAAEHEALAIRASLGIPICRGGRLAAVLAVHSATPRRWTDAEVELVRQAGDRIFASVERARAEAGLAESEAKYRNAVELSPDGILIHRDGAIVFANPAAAALIGVDGPDELLGRSVLEIVHPGQREQVEANIANDLTGETTPLTGVDLLRADGTTVAIQGRGAMIPFGGRPAVQVVLRDVTAERMAVEALRESEERLRLAQESAGIGIWDRDTATGRVTITPAFLGRYGFEAEAIACYEDWLQLIHPDDRDYVEAERRAALPAGRPLEMDFRAVLPGGELRWLQFRGRGIGDDGSGGPARVLGVLLDITERRRAEEALRASEERLHLAQQAAKIAIWDWNVASGRISFSPEFAQLYGIPADAVTDYPAWRRLVHPGDIERVEAERDEAIARDDPFSVEFRVVIPSGEVRWVAGFGRGIRDEHARLVRVIGVNLDATERKEIEAERARFTAELQRSNEELQRFAYVASHDLQEPLRSIISFSQLLERRYKGKLDQDADEFIQFIVEGGNRMQRLIQDLLQFSRVQTKGRPFEPTETAEVVAGVLQLMETPIREAGATVTVGPLPRVMADPAQLAQVFSNLVSNALKFQQPDVPAEVRISAERDGRFWRFSVADNGIGIGAEYHDRIFVIFQRLHTRDEYDGTGIGLAVVQRIVERHGGRAWVESTPGEGSTFFFTLPAA